MEVRGRPTMDDVARVAGVSKATVSRVLAGLDSGSSAKTAEAVRQAAARLGYIVNSVAAGLRSRQSFTIGLIVADVSNPFFGGIASGVEARLSETRYSVLFANTGNSVVRERAAVRLLVERQIDGLIAAPSGTLDAHFREARQRGVRMVLVNSEIVGLGADSVTLDNRAAGKAATRHLLELGHRRIAIVTGPLDASFDRQRLEGYRAALDAFAVPQREACVLCEDLATRGGEDAAARMLQLVERPTAVFVTNNMMTLGVLLGLSRAGVKIPDDMSIVGFDDQDWYAVSHPPLTAVTNPGFEMGAAAADRLLRQLGRKRGSAECTTLEPRLVVRDSTAPPGGVSVAGDAAGQAIRFDTAGSLL